MIDVPIPAGASGAPGTYCVDRTEVTNTQYAAFLATNPSIGTQPTFCTWNTSFQPQSSGSDCLNVSLVFDVTNLPANPVACVDWCDAYAYCRSINKRLCGAFGGGGVPVASGADATRDEWYSACSKAGTQKFPYGNTYDSSACNMDTYRGGQANSVTVAEAARCVGGYPTIHDMNGNVGEWEDSCTAMTGDTDMCSTRGGDWLSFDSTDPTKAGNCLVTPKSPRSRRSSRVGFRCCYDGR
jgi:formylglycine-generating enzyme required for sulfatase activity